MGVLQVEIARGIATLALDSPPNRNALSTALMTELLAALAAAGADDAVRVVVLSHTGPVFCSGADLTEKPAPTALMAEVIAAIWECPKPVVARVGGPARAGGLGLVAAADIAVCGEDVTFAFTEVRLGVVPAIISATVLRRLHPRAAAELFLTGDAFDGRRAAAIGLVSAAAPAESVDATVAAYCDGLMRGGPLALAGTKRVLHRPPAATVREDLAELAAISAEFFGSEEGREGISARREKRPPRWAPLA
ncbi:enoyl-CoA hydratase-related protein [Actinomycetes bacterium KLBMP 9797]